MSEAAVEWVATTPSNAILLYDRAVVGGYDGGDGSQLWVIRAKHEGDLLPGKLDVKQRVATVPWKVEAHVKQDIEVCCKRPDKIQWVKGRDGGVPQNAVVGGYTKDGEKLYVGRVKQGDSLIPGKVHPSHKVLYVPVGHKETGHKEYEVLCTI